MNIGIDARCLEWQRGGVARFLGKMLQLWPELTNRHRYTLYFNDRIPEDDFLKNSIIECRIIRGPEILKRHRISTEQILLPIEIAGDPPDLFFAPWYYAPLFCRCRKSIVAAWDISYTTHKSHYTWREGVRLSFFSRATCRKASGVITCSAYDARIIAKHYGIPAQQICVLQLAPDEQFEPVTDARQLQDLRKKYNLPAQYILSMGVISNRRNVGVIVEAFKEIRGDYPKVGLVVIGDNKTVPFVDIEKRMSPLIEEGCGTYMRWIPECDLKALYSGALVYICTSTVDGETIMLKEAMRCGTAAITSPLISESVGQNALLINDPTSRQETADVFRRVLGAPELRKLYAERGIRWARNLSWTKVAQDCLAFFESR
jgi:glycosyltransferase involved in cell wall biosynthesis